MELERVSGATLRNAGRPIRIASDILLVKALTGTHDGIAVLETVAAPGGPAPLDHVHASYDEVFYIVEGEFRFRVADSWLEVGSGAVVSVPRGSAHTFHNCGDADGRVLIIATPGRTAQMLEDIGTMIAAPGPTEPYGLASVYKRHDTVLVPPLPE